MSEEDTLECLEYAIESRIKTVKKPKDVFDAKALVALYDRLQFCRGHHGIHVQ
jgi:hypothetical protein